MKFDVNAYGEKVQDTVDNSRQCGATMFGPDNGPIAGK